LRNVSVRRARPLLGHQAGPVGPGHGVGDAVAAHDVDEADQGTQPAVADATRSRAARLSRRSGLEEKVLGG